MFLLPARALLAKVGIYFWELPGGPSRYPDLTGSVRFRKGADVCLNPASREPVWTWQPAELFTTCVLTSICLPWSLFGLKTGVGAGCGLQGQSSFLGDSCSTSTQMVQGRRSWLGVPPLKWSSHLEPPWEAGIELLGVGCLPDNLAWHE